MHLLFYLLFLLLQIPLAHAESLPEVVVTADFRQANQMATSNSLTIIDEEVIQARAAQHIEEIISAIPNMNYAGGTSRARFFQIRGIGERSQFVEPLNPSVGVLLDDIDFSGAGSLATLHDVRQIEVFRGPAGTRYGANALAGLIAIRTADPTDEFFAEISGETGSHGSHSAAGILSGPLTSSLAARLAIQQFNSDGYLENAFLNRSDTNHRDEFSSRLKVNWTPSDQWNVTGSLFNVELDNGYDGFSLDNNRTTLSDEPGFDRQSSRAIGINSRFQGNGFIWQTLFNIAHSDLDYGYDEDWSFTGIHPWGYTSTDHYFRDRETESVEVRLMSSDNNWAGDWVMGIYSLKSEEELLRRYTYASDFGSQFDFDTSALFGELNLALNEKLMLETGLRFERRGSDYVDSSGVRFSPEDDMWGGKVGLTFEPEDNLLIFSNISRGYKAGGFNTDGTLDVDLRTFSPETLTELELGIKSRLLDDQLHLSAAVFYDDRRNQQVKSSLVRVRPDGTTAFIDFIGNAAEGTNKGVEIESRWQATDRLQLTFNMGYLRANFDRFINEFGEDLSGRQQAHAPNFTYHGAMTYQLNQLTINLQLEGKDEFYFSDRHGVSSDPYHLLNASIQYETGSWQATLWARNLGDVDYAIRAFGSFGNDPRKGYITEPYFQYGEPRVFGFRLRYRFNPGES